MIYMPRATGRGQTRAGLTEDELADDVVAMLESGKNIVTTTSDLFAGGVRFSDENRARVLKAAEQGKTSVWASGSDPGFITETLPFALLSVQRRIDLIEIEEFGDLSYRPSANMVMEQMRFGKPLDEFDPDRRKNHLFGEYQPPLTVLADAAGFDVDEWTSEGGVAAAKHDTKIVSGEIKAGTAGSQRVIITGRSGGKDVIRFIQYAYVTREVDPPWELHDAGCARPRPRRRPVRPRHGVPRPARRHRVVRPACNANGPVNTIPYVCAAAPGIVSTEDLGLVALPRRPREKS